MKKVPQKVKVPKAQTLLAVFPSRVNSNPIDNIKSGKLLNIILSNLYTKALLGEDKTSLVKLAKDFDKETVYKIYIDIILDLEDYLK